MQTFLPYEDFEASAVVLDNKRLNKQITEARQILNALEKRRLKIKGGWVNHPAVKMWEGYENALRKYHNVMLREWKSRGGNYKHGPFYLMGEVKYPSWLGDKEFHRSHRGNLKRKDGDFYRFGDVTGEEEYIWPV